MLQELGIANAAPLSLSALLINLVIGIFLAMVLRWHFRTFGSTLSNREEFAQVFPFILLTRPLCEAEVRDPLDEARRDLARRHECDPAARRNTSVSLRRRKAATCTTRGPGRRSRQRPEGADQADPQE